MKKINKNCIVPFELENYFNANPNKSWDNFKDECQTGYKEVLTEIKQNQGGICCYCEIAFKDERDIRDDFRVEHFHPKSDTDNPQINWNLIWTNLLGCCLGGTDKTVLNKTRFISDKKHRHSDVLKDNNIWKDDDEILYPLDIPAFPPLFKVYSDGEMRVFEENCVDHIEILKAKNCLDNAKLNLNSPILKEWRKEVRAKLRKEVARVSKIEDYEDAVNMVMSSQLEKDALGNYQSFFSTIRNYFGEGAEDFLKENNFNG